MMTRRRFAFWIGFGLFNLSETLRAETFDKLAAAAMRRTDVKDGSGERGTVPFFHYDNRGATVPAEKLGQSPSLPTHWSASGDETWRWYERESLIDGQWTPTGITTPINKKTGERKTEHGGYLEESLLPEDLRASNQAGDVQADSPTSSEHDPHLPTAECKGRHGRPPSEWLRSLYADEIRIWLKSIKVPEADVSGMTYWEHLTRDHFFDPKHIEGLTIEEQAKLHAAAHFGY
jgi:hypothetical protein